MCALCSKLAAVNSATVQFANALLIMHCHGAGCWDLLLLIVFMPLMVPAAKAAKRAEQKAKRAAKEAAKAEKKGSGDGADDTSDQENPNGAAAAEGLSHSVSQVSLSKSDNQPWDEDHGRSTTGVLASHPQSRDIQIDSFTLLFHGHELLADTRLELNYGRRYGLLGLNGCGKSCMLQVRDSRRCIAAAAGIACSAMILRCVPHAACMVARLLNMCVQAVAAGAACRASRLSACSHMHRGQLQQCCATAVLGFCSCKINLCTAAYG